MIYLAGGGEVVAAHKAATSNTNESKRTTVHGGGRNSTMGKNTGSSTHNQLFKPFSTLAQKSLYIKLLNSTAMEYD